MQMYYLMMIHLITGGYQTVTPMGEFQSYEKCQQASKEIVVKVNQSERQSLGVQNFVCVKR
jgi:hypothetical protein